MTIISKEGTLSGCLPLLALTTTNRSAFHAMIDESQYLIIVSYRHSNECRLK